MIWFLLIIYVTGIALTWKYGFYEWELASDKILLSIFWIAFIPVKLLFAVFNRTNYG